VKPDLDTATSISNTETFPEREEEVQKQQVMDAPVSPAIIEQSTDDQALVPYTQPLLLPPPPMPLSQHLLLPPPPFSTFSTGPALLNNPLQVRVPFPPPLSVRCESSRANMIPHVPPYHPPELRPRPPMRSLPQTSNARTQPSSSKAIKSTDWVSLKVEARSDEDYLGSRVERVPRTLQSKKPIKSDDSVVLIKSYQHTGSVPRFVPRQLVKRPLETAAVQPSRLDPVNEELKKTALLLGSVPQGPALPPDEEHKRKMLRTSGTGDSSIDETVAIIRRKVSEVCVFHILIIVIEKPS
jgi:hypothetical protein